MEIGSCSDDWRVGWIADDNCSNGQLQSAFQLVDAAGQIHFGWVACDALALAGAAIVVIVDGMLKLRCLVTRPIVDNYVVHDVAVHRVSVGVIGIGGKAGTLLVVVHFIQPVYIGCCL